ncbi:MAG: hypothetical protein JWM80_3934 [Cyanobacteria bacterium RYN_339]|nr:hypothetical protein [Cyanobacteria bacterium RYN_339]
MKTSWAGAGTLAMLTFAACAQPTQDEPRMGAPAKRYGLLALAPTYRQTWASVAVGAQPADWINVTKVGPAFPWLVAGAWGVKVNAAGAHTFEQSGIAWPWFSNSPPLSFQRFNAPFFGMAGNALPNHYQVDVTLRVLGCDPKDPYFPIGDTGVQVYFVDATHYCEFIYRPKTVELWQCNGGEPFRFPGWTLLGRFPRQSFQGQALMVSAEVNTATHTIKAVIPGASAPITVSSVLIQPRPHWMTLRASNSRVQYDLVQVKAL